MNLKRTDNYAALSDFSICYPWKNMQNFYEKNKFKISSPTWSGNLDLPDGSYFVSDIQD